jgi:hypothetical protein
MYELTCPACKHVMKTPFARIGAMASCAHCKQRFPVTAEALRRVGTAQPSDALAAPAAEPHAPAPHEPPKPAARRPAAEPPLPRPVAGGPVGADLLDDEEEDPASSDVEALAGAAAGVSGASRRRRQLLHNQRRRQRGPVIVLSIVCLLMAVGLTWAVIYFRGRPAGLPAGGAAMQPSPAAVVEDTLDPSLTLLAPEPVERPTWSVVHEPGFVASKPHPPVYLQNDRALRDASGHHRFEADVETKTFDVVVQATAVLTLVDQEGTAYARIAWPLRLLTAKRAARLGVPIPDDLFARLDTVDCKMEVDPSQRVAGGAPFENPILEPRAMGARTGLEVRTYNPLQTPLSRAIFLVTAYDAQENQIGAWLLNWRDPVGGKQPVKFAAMLPLHTRDVARWAIAGEGVPERTP